MTSDNRLASIEATILDLQAQIARNQRILQGDSDLGGHGLVARLGRLEGIVEIQTKEFANFMAMLENERKIRDAIELERTRIFKNLEKWIKILGPLLGGGLGLQLIFDVFRQLNGG